MWVSTRNMLNCCWSDKERNRPCKRIYRKTVEGWDGWIDGDGHDSCRGLSGELIRRFLAAAHLDSYLSICLTFLSLWAFYWFQIWWLSLLPYRGVSVLILAWAMRRSKLYKKLCRRQGTLILGTTVLVLYSCFFLTSFYTIKYWYSSSILNLNPILPRWNQEFICIRK